MENCNSFFDDLGGPMMKKASTKILSVEQLAEIMGIDINDPRPNLSDPQVVSRLAKKFTKDCLEELEQEERIELESMARAHNVAVWG
jgi:hypothetical protein